jgi:hypothetical protein
MSRHVTRPRQAMSARELDRVQAQLRNLLRLATVRADGRIGRVRAGLRYILGQLDRSERR